MQFSSLNSLSKLQKRFAYGDKLKPYRDWFLLLGLMLLILVASVGWNIVTFFRAVDGEVIGTTEPPKEIFDEAAVERVEEAFTARAEEEARYRTTYQFVDPSLGGR